MTIAPYTAIEVQEAIRFLVQHELFLKGVQYFHPNWTIEEIQNNLSRCRSCADFEIIFVEPIIKNIIDNSISKLEVIGLENLTKQDNFLYISNHRDIFLDAGLLQYCLYHRGLPFTEISLGDNLMMDKLIEVVAKMNNMFTVYRSGTRMELLRNAQQLSTYLRHAISKKRVSAWIAQGNGRAKDGFDRTFPGLINMLLMSGDKDYKKSLEELKIMVSTVSYEYEPCAFEKAIELEHIASNGSYKKTQYEDLQSILKGIEAQKGNVALVFEPLGMAQINFSGSRKEVLKSIVQAIDNIVYKNYRLWKTNYLAHDMLHQSQQFQQYYTTTDWETFQTYLNQGNHSNAVIKQVLKIYATPVDNCIN